MSRKKCVFILSEKDKSSQINQKEMASLYQSSQSKVKQFSEGAVKIIIRQTEKNTQETKDKILEAYPITTVAASSLIILRFVYLQQSGKQPHKLVETMADIPSKSVPISRPPNSSLLLPPRFTNISPLP